jgi:hypothetical protein
MSGLHADALEPATLASQLLRMHLRMVQGRTRVSPRRNWPSTLNFGETASTAGSDFAVHGQVIGRTRIFSVLLAPLLLACGSEASTQEGAPPTPAPSVAVTPPPPPSPEVVVVADTPAPPRPTPPSLSKLRVDGRRFVDDKGRTVLLRGVNFAGNSKMPPFLPSDDMADLDKIVALGMNVIRLPFIWEAFEPTRGIFQTSYLNKMVSIAQAATDRGLYVLVDFHQDGFSRWSISGCGSGFPQWTTPVGVTPVQPNNSEARCADWGAKMFTDTGMHSSFSAFHSDKEGAKGSFLEMVRRSTSAFSSVRGVIGYDLLNEPWGTDAELSALYDAEGAVIRQEAPEAILFVEAHITTNARFTPRRFTPPKGAQLVPDGRKWRGSAQGA